MVAMDIIVTMATERVINISQYKAAAVTYLIVGISAILRPPKHKIWYEDASSPNSQFR